MMEKNNMKIVNTFRVNLKGLPKEQQVYYANAIADVIERLNNADTVESRQAVRTELLLLCAEMTVLKEDCLSISNNIN